MPEAKPASECQLNAAEREFITQATLKAAVKPCVGVWRGVIPMAQDARKCCSLRRKPSRSVMARPRDAILKFS